MKVTFDGVNKLMIINTGITSIDVKTDIYSEWKVWAATGDNTKYELAISAIGGDPITDVISLGSTFFLENGWKIRPYEGSQTLTISGNIYSRDGSSVIVPTLGNYNVTVDLSTSNLIDTVNTAGSSVSTDDIANGVWNKMTAANTSAGSFGEMVGAIKSLADSNATVISTLTTKVNTATDLVTALLKYEKNRTKIDQSAMTLTVYDDDDVSVLRVFQLKNFAGSPSITEIAERIPV